MSAPVTIARAPLAAVLALVMFGGCASSIGNSQASVALSGGNEVPPVATAASGDARFTVDRDGRIQGKLTTRGVAATAAHIHEAAAGSNGPVIIPLARTAENEWSLPPGARLSDAQFGSYRAGRLYVNVHSAAYPGGEIRGQLTP